MDEAALEAWSETLMNMRQERMDQAQKEFDEKGNTYAPADFYHMATSNIDKILDRWISAEQTSWEANLPSDPATAMKDIRSETDSVIDLELEAIQRDIQALQQQANWESEVIQSADAVFQSSINELRNKYQLKLNSFSGAQRKKAPAAASSALAATITAPTMKMNYSGSSGGSGSSAVLLFVVGLVLGAAPSLYFWDANTKIEKKSNAEKEKILSEIKTVEDNYALLHDVFSQMAGGKMRSLAEMEEEIQKLKSEASARRRRVEQEYSQERDRLIRKYSGTDMTDQVLEDLEFKKVKRDGEIRAQEQRELETLEKQRKVVKDLLAG